MVQSLWKTVWRFLRKLRIELPYDPAIPLLGIYPDKTILQRDTSSPVFTAALFTIAKTWKQLKCPSTDEWIKMYIYTMEYYSAIKENMDWIKMWYIYTMEYYSTIKKNETTPFAATWMQLEILILSEVGQKKRQIPYYITSVWNLKCGTNEPVYTTETDSQP